MSDLEKLTKNKKGDFIIIDDYYYNTDINKSEMVNKIQQGITIMTIEDSKFKSFKMK